jgi:hypothetical protein
VSGDSTDDWLNRQRDSVRTCAAFCRLYDATAVERVLKTERARQGDREKIALARAAAAVELAELRDREIRRERELFSSHHVSSVYD